MVIFYDCYFHIGQQSHGSQSVVQAAAGFYFDPSVEGYDSRWGANVTKNVIAVPVWLGGYRGAVNTDAFSLDGYAVGVRMARLSAITLSKWQERNGVRFRILTMRIDLDEDTWVKQTLNDGLYEIAAPGETATKMGDGHEQEVTEPWPLDAAGKQIAKPTPANVTYISSRIYKEGPFSVLPLT